MTSKSDVKAVEKLDNRDEGEQTATILTDDSLNQQKPSVPVQKDNVQDYDDENMLDETDMEEGEEDINLINVEDMKKYGI